MRPVPNKNTAEVTQGLNISDNLDFTALYVNTFPLVKKFVLANNGNESDAGDICQEAFISLWRNIQMGKFEEKNDVSTAAYVLKIARYKWLDELRRRKRNNLLVADYPEEGEAGEQVLSDNDEQYLNKVVEHFQKMKQPCKDLLYRFYYLKERFSVIADHFGWTEASAKNNKYRCLQKLRDAIQQKDNTR